MARPVIRVIVTYRCYTCGDLINNVDGTTPDISEGRQLFVSESADYSAMMPPRPLPKDTTVHHIEHLEN